MPSLAFFIHFNIQTSERQRGDFSVIKGLRLRQISFSTEKSSRYRSLACKGREEGNIRQPWGGEWVGDEERGYLGWG